MHAETQLPEEMVPVVVDGQLTEVSALSLREREARGHDRLDEVWEGVLHMNPQPLWDHQSLASELLLILGPLAKARGWHAVFETSVLDPEQQLRDYRTPDLLVVDPAYTARRGVEGRVELAIEIRSPRDEAYEKIPFFAKHNVQEYLIIELDRTVRRYVWTDGELVEQSAASDGSHRLATLPITLSTTTDGGGQARLHVVWPDGEETI